MAKITFTRTEKAVMIFFCSVDCSNVANDVFWIRNFNDIRIKYGKSYVTRSCTNCSMIEKCNVWNPQKCKTLEYKQNGNKKYALYCSQRCLDTALTGISDVEIAGDLVIEFNKELNPQYSPLPAVDQVNFDAVLNFDENSLPVTTDSTTDTYMFNIVSSFPDISNFDLDAWNLEIGNFDLTQPPGSEQDISII